MHKGFFTFAASCLLLATFTGDADANKVDVTFDLLTARHGYFPRSSDNLADLELTRVDNKKNLKLLLAQLTDPSADSEEVPAYAKEKSLSDTSDEAVSLSEGLIGDFDAADTSQALDIAGPTDREDPPAQTTDVYVPAVRRDLRIPNYYSSIDPPITVIVYLEAVSKRKHPVHTTTNGGAAPVIVEKEPTVQPDEVKGKPPAAGPTGPATANDQTSRRKDEIAAIPPPPFAESEKPEKETENEPPWVGTGVTNASEAMFIPPEMLALLPAPPDLPDPFADPGLAGSPPPVPEPGTMLLFATGLAGFAATGLRRMKSSSGNSHRRIAE